MEGDSLMKAIEISLQIDSPVFLHGAAVRQLEPSGQLRGASIRGLLHTWARALIGPCVDGDPARTRHAEELLMGGAGTATLRVTSDSGGGRLRTLKREPLLPHKKEERGKVRRDAFDVWQSTTVKLAPRPHVAGDALLAGAIAAVAWTSFSLGALGQRSRRGMGSLTVTALDGGGLSQPAFPALPAREDLACELYRGLEEARSMVRAWVDAIPRSEAAESTARPGEGDEEEGARSLAARQFFQVAGPSDVWISRRFPSGRQAVVALMHACSAAKTTHGAVFEETMGRAPETTAELKRRRASKDDRKPKLASSLWVRTYQLRPEGATTGDDRREGREHSSGAVLVATFSPRCADRRAVDAVLRAVGAEPLVKVAATAG